VVRIHTHPSVLWENEKILPYGMMCVKIRFMPDDIFAKAKNTYPLLNDYDIHYVNSPMKDAPYKLEAWSPGTKNNGMKDRPNQIPQDKYGVEVYQPDTSEHDVAADIVSHFLVEKDPEVKKHYQQFSKEITEGQKKFLKGDYQEEQRLYKEGKAGDPGSFEEWLPRVGIPAALRGMAFNQYPNPEDRKQFGLTTKQQEAIDGIMKRVGRPMGMFEKMKQELGL